MLPSLSAITSVVTPSTRLLGDTEIQRNRRLQLTRYGMAVSCIQPRIARSSSCARRLPSRSLICAAALNARCAEGQTQTVTPQSSTITIAPTQGKFNTSL